MRPAAANMEIFHIPGKYLLQPLDGDIRGGIFRDVKATHVAKPRQTREETAMNDAQLTAFRQIANIMLGPEARDWNWSGPMWGEYGITEQRAATMHAKYGGKIWKNEQDNA